MVGVRGSQMCPEVRSLDVLVIVSGVVSIGVHMFSRFSPTVEKSTEFILRVMNAYLERRSLLVEEVK